ncbi:Predicted oxidoreductase, contains short-chain dehydrogenase (SDR) and DUF2520 domains [Hymenobacter daecheongensis DSM 21074]|uniref:Predicted oxidoreductase, contains short-chain dehydrogenase (SDR) and DUF2520 domains n=1 Tax=Hymenobacter daecheongensis DSM 21074 TaxID=1121955 RepID=A0A1M6MLB0_9BACT|nr:DUF2520 domain-containing protein [Hymenobacter daecheongensis]SHJ84258.1 Predicted oxidoreductase, contains short-chain dehydrogenase (SDR) and DUF2520 domains [Hymenobacter daecheongensis DSM 21074]
MHEDYPLLRIVLLGAGRVAAHLGPALWRAGHHVAHVWSRTAASAAALAAQIPGAAPVSGQPLHTLPLADVYIVAVPDAAVAAVLAIAGLPAGALVVHTAGALPLAVFEGQPALRGGVFYPLQTFSPGRAIDWATVPLCVEAAHPTDETTLLALAHSLSKMVYVVATPQRQALHVAAVFASNFTNHLLGISHALTREARLPFDLLLPLVRETVEKALLHPPFTVQTGPAVRHDAGTLALHRAALAAHPAWQAVYNELTASIQAQNRALTANNGDLPQL